jgi:hypothetical protein
MERWFTSQDLASVRDESARAALPERERLAWSKFWEDATALRNKLGGQK